MLHNAPLSFTYRDISGKFKITAKEVYILYINSHFLKFTNTNIL